MAIGRLRRPGRLFFVFACVAVLACAMAIGAGRWIHARQKLATVSAVSPTIFSTGNWAEQGGRTLVIGDSRVAEWIPGKSGGDRPVALAVSGVGGETSGQLLARWQQVGRLAPGTRVLILTGVNDLVAANLNPDMAPAIEAGLQRNVTTIAQQARSQGYSPMIGAIGQAGKIDPLRRALGWSSELYRAIERANALLEKQARMDGFGWFDTNAALGVSLGGPVPDSLSEDTLHWTAEAYARLEAAIARLPSESDGS